jgi:hypothetical protein
MANQEVTNAGAVKGVVKRQHCAAGKPEKHLHLLTAEAFQ